MAEGVNNHGYTIEEPPLVGIPVGNGNDAWPEHQESFQCNSESEVDSFTDSDTEGRVAVDIADSDRESDGDVDIQTTRFGGRSSHNEDSEKVVPKRKARGVQFLPYEPQVSETPIEPSERAQDDRRKEWDVFMSFPQSEIDNRRSEEYYQKWRKCFRVFMMIALFFSVLVGGIISLMTMLLAASNFRSDIKMVCDQVAQDKCVALNVYQDPYLSAQPSEPSSEELLQSVTCIPDANLPNETLPGTCHSVMVRWGWCLLLIMITPQLFTFIRCVWLVFFKNVNIPSILSVILVMVIEGLQTMGLTLLVFRVLPQLTSAAHGASLLLGTALVPAVLNLVLPRSTEKRSRLMFALDIAAVVLQALAILIWPLMKVIRNDSVWDVEDELIWAIPISLILTSLHWWENFIPAEDHDIIEAGIPSPRLTMMNLTRDVRHCRIIIYMISSIWKVGLTFMFFVLWMLIDYDIDAMFDFDGRLSNILCIDHLQISSMDSDWVWVWLINLAAGVVTYFAGRSAAKALMQAASYFMPLALTFPVVFLFLVGGCSMWNHDRCRFDSLMPVHSFWRCFDRGQLGDIFLEQWLMLALLWWISQLIIGRRAWIQAPHKLSLTASIFSKPLFDGAILNQWMFYNWSNGNSYNVKPIRSEAAMADVMERNGHEQKRRRSTKQSHWSEYEIPMIYMCATMWHENAQEMTQILRSIYRCDIDQCAKRFAREQWKLKDTEFYNFETHIFFDDAMSKYKEDNECYNVNDFVTLMVETVNEAGKAMYDAGFPIGHPVKYVTPYGGRLEWTLPGKNKLVAHLKDKKKIRHRKRWSQVMYMYYLLGYKLYKEGKDNQIGSHAHEVKCNNTFVLALDGDVDFNAEALLLLVDLMKKGGDIGAACGRIHPVGAGPMVWYQRFEYSLGHWMQKATEHVLGCVLCSPGCFSLFRASALMDHNVMNTYTKEPKLPIEHLQYDQGEDRWLCTLLIQAGWKIEYSSISDSFTFAPEQFAEFYNQQRRWKPSTMANVYDLITSATSTIKQNDNISGLYIAYQTLLLLTSILGTSTIFLMIVEALTVATGDAVSPWASLFINLVPVTIYSVVCFIGSKDSQLKLATVLSALYALLMMMVMIGMLLEISEEGWCSPNALFFIMVASFFVFAAVVHPQEFWNLPYGIIYFVAIPSMYMLLMIYSVTNINDVSWGTREVPQSDAQKEQAEVEKLIDQQKKIEKRQEAGLLGTIKQIKEEGFSLGMDRVCRCIMCPRPAENDDVKLEMIMESLREVKETLEELQNDKSGGVLRRDISSKRKRRKTLRESIQQEILMEFALADDDDDCSGSHDGDVDPHWITKIEGQQQTLTKDEEFFFKDLIAKYLYPLLYSKEETKTMARELKELRNTMAMGFFMLNALFTVVVFVMQRNVDQLSIDWPCGAEDADIKLDPIGFLFLIYFGSIMLIQFAGMMVHRFGSLLHIVANRKVTAEKKKQDDMVNLMKKGIQENPDLNEYRGQDEEPVTEWEVDKIQRKKSRIFSRQSELGDSTRTYEPIVKKGVDINRRLTRLNQRITKFQKNKDKPVDRDFRDIVRSLGGRQNTMRMVQQIEDNSEGGHPFRNKSQNRSQTVPDYL